MHVALRLAQSSDAPSIAELTRQLGYDVDVEMLAPRLTRILARPDQQFLIAEVEGRPVGWVHGEMSEYVESEPFVVIGGLVVDKARRGQGIGRLLMDAIEAWATRQGCAVVRLWSSSTRTSAHKFYEHIGYAHVKTQYAFLKSIDGRPVEFAKFVPKVDAE
jgi:GNAT superfamily N-acetyltransferase